MKINFTNEEKTVFTAYFCMLFKKVRQTLFKIKRILFQRRSLLTNYFFSSRLLPVYINQLLINRDINELSIDNDLFIPETTIRLNN